MCSHSRGKWLDKPYVVRLVQLVGSRSIFILLINTERTVCSSESRAAWARLIARIYEVNPLTCDKCGSQMKILAIITDPEEVKKILRHLMKIGRPPPGLDPSSLN